MKRLLPFDSSGAGNRFSGLRQETAPSSSADTSVDLTAPRPRELALPVELEPRRTALYAIIDGSDGPELYAHEAPIEGTPIRDTGLVHLTHTAGTSPPDQLTIAVTETTFFDMDTPYVRPKPGTPVIIVGLIVGDIIEAEVIAGMDVEACYRSTVLRYQGSRPRQQPTPLHHQSGG